MDDFKIFEQELAVIIRHLKNIMRANTFAKLTLNKKTSPSASMNQQVTLT